MIKASINKKFEDMSIEELKAEREYWEDKIVGATAWGASLSVASEFRGECDRYIRLWEHRNALPKS